MIHDAFLIEPFQAGVRQGCLLSLIYLGGPGLRYLPVRQAYGAGRTGIQWTLTRKLAGHHMREKLEGLQSAEGRVGLKINTGKTQ